MREAVDNLLSNAIKYSPIGGHIEVMVARKDGHTVIRVRDEGAGLSPEDMGRLFGRFQRLSAKPTAGESSTGLGLSIVKRIVELHGGSVPAESPGPGTRHHLPDDVAGVMSQVAHIAQHICVVDDEAPAREMVGDYLRMHGFAVTLCDGGASLREAIAQQMPDLIVLDLNMPEEDGLSIIRDLKQHAGLPIIMLTATASPIDRVVGLELGADDYLAKPCELRELLARIRSVLRRSARRPTAPAPAAAGAPPSAPVRFGTKWLDLDAQALRDEDGNEHPLTPSEFTLLKAFADNPKRVLSRERLLDLANARDPEAFDRAIDVRITRIRRKIEPDPRHPSVIRTVRGAGYLFSPGSGEKS